MTDTSVQPTAEGTPGLSQMERVIDAFTAPSKTFTDIKNGHTSWWLPLVLFIIVGTGLWAVVNAKVGWTTIAENGVKMSPKASEAMDKLTPEQRQSQMKISGMAQEGIWALAPIWVLVMNLIGAGVLLGTINFGFGGKASFGKVLAVTWYAGLPGLIKLVIGAIGLFAGVAPDAFLPQNPAGTNLGYYMNPLEANKVLFTLATAIDPITIWTMFLIAIGLSTVAGVKRSAGYTAVFGWWFLMLLISIGATAMMG
jgi:Yip1 domain